MGKALVNFPDDLHKDLKRRAIDEGISLKELIVKTAREYIERHPPMRLTLFEAVARKEQQGRGGVVG